MPVEMTSRTGSALMLLYPWCPWKNRASKNTSQGNIYNRIQLSIVHNKALSIYVTCNWLNHPLNKITVEELLDVLEIWLIFCTHVRLPDTEKTQTFPFFGLQLRIVGWGGGARNFKILYAIKRHNLHKASLVQCRVLSISNLFFKVLEIKLAEYYKKPSNLFENNCYFKS